MPERAPWIWIPEEGNEDIQKCAYNILTREGRADRRFAVLEFGRRYSFGRPVASVSLRAGGDTFFTLELNGRTVLSGVSSAGGDFLNNALPRPDTYYYTAELDGGTADLSSGRLNFRAVVRMGPAVMYEHSQGHGGFFACGTVRITPLKRPITRPITVPIIDIKTVFPIPLKI